MLPHQQEAFDKAEMALKALVEAFVDLPPVEREAAWLLGNLHDLHNAAHSYRLRQIDAALPHVAE